LTKRLPLAAIRGLAAAILFLPTATLADQLVTVASARPPAGPSVTINTLVLAPKYREPFVAIPVVPRAVVVLLPGGDGWLDIDTAAGVPRRLTGNFLVRTREALAGQGFLTVLVDAPSDRQNPTGMSGGFRTSDDHAKDLTAIVAHFKPTLVAGSVRIAGAIYGADAINAPIVVVGSSASTVSAVLAAIRPLPTGPYVLPGGNRDVRGVVLTASVTTGATSINSLPVTGVAQPVLFVHHVDDGCEFAKYRNAIQAAFNMMKASVRVSFAEIAGKAPASSDIPGDPDTPVANPDPCGAPGGMGYLHHGFSGAGTAALDAIQRWIATTLKR
jgi:hypothetical protein